MRTRLAVLTVVLLGLAAGAGHAEDSGIPAAYVDIGLGVRPLGMGGAYVALADDEDAARWNPAALARQENTAFGFMWTKQMKFVPLNYISGTLPLRRFGTGYYFQTNGNDVLRESTGAFALGFSLAGLRMPNTYFGVTTKIRWASFGNNESGVGQVTGDAFGYGFDLGLFWDIRRIEGLTAGLVLKDVINNMSWDSSTSGTYDESVPATMAFGFAYRLGERSTFALDMHPALYKDVYWRFAFGAEYILLKAIALRGGYSQDLGAEYVNDNITLGLGLDIKIGGAHLDAGLSYLFNELANTPRVGLAFR